MIANKMSAHKILVVEVKSRKIRSVLQSERQIVKKRNKLENRWTTVMKV